MNWRGRAIHHNRNAELISFSRFLRMVSQLRLDAVFGLSSYFQAPPNLPFSIGRARGNRAAKGFQNDVAPEELSRAHRQSAGRNHQPSDRHGADRPRRLLLRRRSPPHPVQSPLRRDVRRRAGRHPLGDQPRGGRGAALRQRRLPPGDARGISPLVRRAEQRLGAASVDELAAGWADHSHLSSADARRRLGRHP